MFSNVLVENTIRPTVTHSHFDNESVSQLVKTIHSTGSPTFAVSKRDRPRMLHFIVPNPLFTCVIPGMMAF